MPEKPGFVRRFKTSKMLTKIVFFGKNSVQRFWTSDQARVRFKETPVCKEDKRLDILMFELR